MSRNQKLFTLLIAVVAALGLAGALWAQSSTAVMSRSGTVIAKYDGKIAVKMDDGTTKEFTPAPGKTIMVNGVPTGYADLKVGTVLTADFVATTKTVPVTTTEIKNGTLIKIFPAGFIAMTAEKGYQQYDVPKGFRFLVDGKETELSSLREGMKLTATIVSVETKTLTEAEVKNVGGNLAAEPAPAPAAPAKPAAPAAAAEPASAPAPAAAPQLPKTATQLPLLALAGALSLLSGLGLRRSRRDR